MRNYFVEYKNKKGKKVRTVVRALTGDNAWLYVKNKLKGTSIKVRLK